MTGYAAVLAALNSIPWAEAPAVTRVVPRDDFESLNFFPGRKGFVGTEFPMHGVMIVANNYDCLDGWMNERDEEDKSPTWTRMRNIIVKQSTIPLGTFWFTNYCHGVMDNRDKNGKPDPCYSFPRRTCKALQFQRVFEECVGAMKPKVIVALGGDANAYLRFPCAAPERRSIAGHAAKVLATYHTSARVTLQAFHQDAARIREAYHGQ